MSIETAKEAKRRQRPPARPSRALLDVRRAAQELAAAGHATFGTAQLRERLAVAGCGWKPSTVSDLLDQEATWRPDALIERVSYDKYRLRDRPGQQVPAVATGATARTHVLDTLRQLHDQATADGNRVEGFSAAQVHQHLAAVGVRYNRAHLSRVLKHLTQEEAPAVARVDRIRFRPAS